ncbi:MAG: hypothetical protein ACYCS0_01240 [bacterium]
MRKYIIITIISILFISVRAYGYSYSTTPSSAANQAFSQISGAYNSGTINNSLINPLLNSNTQMTTLNGKTSFNAQISCPSSSNLLQLNFLPQSSGDFELLIAQNTNPSKSNSFNYTATVPLISGVCTNGFIACDAGTWNNCKYYQWGTNSQGGIIWNNVSTLQSLGTCFCVNNSCGGLFNSDFKSIAGTIGGGLSMLIAQTDDISISNAQFNMQAGYQLSYYGQSSANCQTVNGSGGYVNPEQFYNNPQALTNEEQNIAGTEATDTNSPYYSITNSEYLKNNPVTEQTCSIDTSVTINTTTSTTNAFCSSGSYDYVTGHNGSAITLLNGCFANANYSSSSGSTTATQYELDCPSGYSLTSQDFVANGSTVSFPDGDGWGGTWTIDPSIYTANACLEYVYAPQVTHDNGCSNLASNTKCKLETKEICGENGQNCVYTVQNYNPTELAPQSMCETVNNPTVSTPNFGSSSLYYWNVCASGGSINYTSNDPASPSGTLLTSNGNNDYWIVRETYTCKSSAPNSYNYTDMENRTNEVNNSLTASGGSSYTDTEYNSNGTQTTISGIPTNYSGNATAAGLGATPCVYSCVVENNVSNSQALDTNSDTTNTALNGTTPSNTVASKTILTCTQNQALATGAAPSNNTWVCPAEAGETILKPCQCLNESNYAIATVSVLGSAANSMICSAN